MRNYSEKLIRLTNFIRLTALVLLNKLIRNTKRYIMKDTGFKFSPKEDAGAVSVDAIRICRPDSKNGAAVHDFIAGCHPLDANSMYCNLLQCTHFSETCAMAEIDGKLYGFVSGYLHPDDPSVLFIWQVAVHEDVRGLGLGKEMLSAILRRTVCDGVEKIQTTITRDNKASWALFKSLARDLGAGCQDEVLFDRGEHFHGRHASEYLLTIGPIRK